MSDLYIVRWGPALGDDYSCQVFTTKETMNAFVELLVSSTKVEGWGDLSLEVHFVTGKNIDIIPDVEGEDVDVASASNLIAFGSTENVIWRINTERHR